MKILVADIGGTSIKMGLANEKGELQSYQEYDTESEKGGRYIVNKLMEVMTDYEEFDAIGISTAGQVNTDQGIIIYANENIPGYTGTRLKEQLQERFHVPVKVENDVNAAALGEKYYGAAQSFEDFLCLTYGTGIGGAIVMNSRIYHGTKGLAGEIGHMITHPKGELCNCGGHGCYERYASTTALVKMARTVDASIRNGRDIFIRFEHGDTLIKSILEQWVLEISLGLASVIHIFNPSAIIIGGGIMDQPVLVEWIDREVKKIIMPSFADVKIIRASLGNKAGILGALSLHTSNVL